MSDHAKLSPSARHRWGKCPGSVREEAKYPEQPSGPAAIDGTHTHYLLETCLRMGMVKAKEFIGQTLHDDDGSFTIDKDRAERVQFALNYVATRVYENPSLQVISESRVDPAIYFNRTDLSGTVDIQLINEEVLEIVDYKDGMMRSIIHSLSSMPLVP
jgi:hypothetical protein